MHNLDANWHYESLTPNLVQAERITEVLFEGKTPYQKVSIVDAACFGKMLLLDGKTQSTEVDEFVYHEALVQPTMIAHSNPKRVFVAGGGEGATIREVLKHKSVTKVVMVDIDEQVIELCQRYLPSFHEGAFNDPRLDLHYADASRFLEESDQEFDLAIIDVPDPLEEGPAYMLFTQEFYRLLRKSLASGGMMVAQAGPTGPAFAQQCFSAVAKTVQSVFTNVYMCEAFVPSFGSTWGFVVGSLGPDPSGLSAKEVDQRITERIDGKLGFYDGITNRGMFSVPKYLRNALVSQKRVITRDNPLFVV